LIHRDPTKPQNTSIYMPQKEEISRSFQRKVPVSHNTSLQSTSRNLPKLGKRFRSINGSEIRSPKFSNFKIKDPSNFGGIGRFTDKFNGCMFEDNTLTKESIQKLINKKIKNNEAKRNKKFRKLRLDQDKKNKIIDYYKSRFGVKLPKIELTKSRKEIEQMLTTKVLHEK